MRDRLPRHIDVAACVGSEFKGSLPASTMSRWLSAADSHATPSKPILVTVQVRREAHLLVITGSVQTEIELVCQRCLSPYCHVVCTPINWSPVSSGSAAQNLPPHLDPVQLNRGVLDLYWHVEDHLLLELPSFPKHARVADCEQNEVLSTLGRLGSDSRLRAV